MRADSDLLTQLVDLLKNRSDDVVSLLQGPQVPLSIFKRPYTILQALTTYLVSQQYSQKDIAIMIGKPQSAIHNAIVASKYKPEFEVSDLQITISPTIFRQKLSPAECLMYHLVEERHISNAKVAHLLGRDPRNTHKQLQSAKKKMGGVS